MSNQMCGGASEVHDATVEIHELVKEIRNELESKINKTFPTYKAVSYRSQLVAGTNYFVKIQVADDDYIHVRIYKPLPHTNKGPEVHSYLLSKSNDDKLEYF